METVVITGANRGIGLELTRVFLSKDFHVIASCRRPDQASELQALAESKELEIHELDVTDASSISAFSSALSDITVDMLINNAGVFGGERQSLNSMDYDIWLETFNVNTIAPFHVTIALKNNLKKAERPRVVTLSSQMGSLSRKSTDYYAYRSSKAALNKVMQVMALELKEDNIIVCPVHPGWVRTDMGGAEADITAQESASGLYQLIDSLTMEQSGRFWTWQRDEHPW